MSLEFVKYEKIIKDFKELEEQESCPFCGHDVIYHCDPYSYKFFCGVCDKNFTLKGLYNEELENKMIAWK